MATCCSSASLSSSVARLHLVEEPHILDGNDGLVGERLEQRNLLLTEWPHLGTTDRQCADCLALAQKRSCEN